VNRSPILISSIAVLAAGLSAAALLYAQAPAQAPPPAAQQPPAPGAPGTPPPPAVPASRKFTGDGGMIFNIIKPDKTADFEAVMAKVKEALAKSDKPGRKQMALSWRVFKGVEAGLGGNVVYVFWFDPPVKDEDYSITQILSEGFPNDAQDLWSKFVSCFASGQTMLNLSQVVNMSPNATATVPK
jgi:hypothetical protein